MHSWISQKLFQEQKMGSKSYFEYFMDVDATPDLGKKLCEQD